MKHITFVTGNIGKLREVKQIIPNIYLEARDIDLMEVQGEPEIIVSEKCKLATQMCNEAVLVEDTSLCFKSLGGLPGPYVKWFLKKIGPEGLVSLLSSYRDKSATALCVFGFCIPGKNPILFRGETEGIIVDSPRGSSGFGWDVIFQPNGFDKTYAELPSDIKNSISHRSKALKKLKEYFDLNISLNTCNE